MISLPGRPVVAHRDGRTARAIATDGRTLLTDNGAVWRVADLAPTYRDVIATVAS